MIRMIDGTEIRAEIREASSSHLEFRILTPFVKTVSQEIPIVAISLLGISYVQEGRATFFLTQHIESAMQSGLLDWQRLNRAEEHFVANRTDFEPIIRSAHLGTANACNELQAILDRMLSLGHALELEFVRFKSQPTVKRQKHGHAADKHRVKLMGNGAPDTDLSRQSMDEAKQLRSRYQILRDLLEKTRGDFNLRTSLRLEEAFLFVGLTGLPIQELDWKYGLDELSGLSKRVQRLLLGPRKRLPHHGAQ